MGGTNPRNLPPGQAKKIYGGRATDYAPGQVKKRQGNVYGNRDWRRDDDRRWRNNEGVYRDNRGVLRDRNGRVVDERYNKKGEKKGNSKDWDRFRK